MLSGDCASGQAVPVNLSLLSLFEKQLVLSYHVGLTVREAAALELSLRSQAEALSHSMWVLSGLLGFVRLQNFAPAYFSLFNIGHLIVVEPCTSGHLVCFPHGPPGAETQAVLPVSPACALLRDE